MAGMPVFYTQNTEIQKTTFNSRTGAYVANVPLALTPIIRSNLIFQLILTSRYNKRILCNRFSDVSRVPVTLIALALLIRMSMPPNFFTASCTEE